MHATDLDSQCASETTVLCVFRAVFHTCDAFVDTRMHRIDRLGGGGSTPRLVTSPIRDSGVVCTRSL